MADEISNLPELSAEIVFGIPRPERNLEESASAEAEMTTISDSWRPLFESFDLELQDIAEIIGKNYYPPPGEVFRAFRLTPLPSVRVVIIGQDPYPGLDSSGQPAACGLAFSGRPGASPPASLKTIFEELAKDIPGFAPPPHGDLSSWARQGVLLFNKSLTVAPGCPGSHGNMWLGLVKAVVKAVQIACPRVIFLLWGSEAQKLRGLLHSGTRVLTAAHPSPNSKGFVGCRHFSLVNKLLEEQGDLPIEWKIQ